MTLMADPMRSHLLLLAASTVLFAAFLAAWIGLHRASWGAAVWTRRVVVAMRIAAGALSWLVALDILGRLLVLDMPWGRWTVALLGSLSVEAVVALYARERRTVKPRTSRRLLALRLAMLTLVLLVLIQPVLTYELAARCERYIAVLLDDSASMSLSDPQANDSERAQLAKLYGMDASSGDASRRDLARQPRRDVANYLLTHAADGNPSLLDALGKNRSVRVYRFASTPKATDPHALGGVSAAMPEGWGEATDLAAALSMAQTEIPADQLAGVLMVGDGRHNLGAPAEPLARRLGQAGVPVCSVVVGSVVPPRDAAVTDVNCPDTVFLNDRVNLNAHLRATGQRGQTLKIKLIHDGQTVDEKSVTVDSDDFRSMVALADTPKKIGLHSYVVEMDATANDFIKENNRVESYVAVTDARIKLLLVDDRPRWEYRYVRNLFTGRDKTVQMQHLLLSPDRLDEASPQPRVAASASRPYGEFEATALPQSPDDWLKFEVIILGDVPRSAMTPSTIETLERFVGVHGGTLIVVAGPNAMPHAYTETKLADLLPATFDPSTKSLFAGPEAAYRLALSPEGGSHAIMRVRTNPTDNAALWNALPPIDWRHPVRSIKPGATVLAYAEPMSADGAAFDAASSHSDAAGDLSPDAAGVLASKARSRQTETERMQLLRKNPLIVLHKYGAGNVLLLNFDRTWRLRYRVGDTYHHRFWSQVLRWATANKLSAGTPHVRLATDRYRYQAGNPITLRSQLVDEQDRPVLDAKVVARVYRDRRLVLTKTLDLAAGSRGVYQGDLGSLRNAGRYRVELEGPAVAKLLAVDKADKAGAEFSIASVERTSEWIDVGAEWRLPKQLAELSGGKAVGPGDARSVLDVFTADSKVVRKQRNIPLWDSWPMLLLILTVASGEWILRKKAGLP
jgi:hypothetical protein